ncbi:MAG: redoxin domain-containing protein [Methanomassiliicoccales archaeon]|nr:redoxin domain-containing protein [Methanomassiliicoccales archaeon]
MDLRSMPDVGEKAPDFELPDDMGRPVRLSEVASKAVTILMFYPADFGMICSIQMGELRGLFQEFEASNILILPVSTNSVRSHSAWKESMRLPFPLLADEDGKVTRMYQIDCDDDDWLKNRACRGAFILDRDLVIRHRWIPPSPHFGPDVPALLAIARAIS